MKNVTITVDEEVLRWARVWAAQHGSSVSKMLGELLRQHMKRDKSYALAMKRDAAREPVMLKSGGRYPSRDELYERE